MSKELTHPIGGKKFTIFLAVLAVIAVFAAIGVQVSVASASTEFEEDSRAPPISADVAGHETQYALLVVGDTSFAAANFDVETGCFMPAVLGGSSLLGFASNYPRSVVYSSELHELRQNTGSLVAVQGEEQMFYSFTGWSSVLASPFGDQLSGGDTAAFAASRPFVIGPTAGEQFLAA